jgi:hypothetical protein
MLLALGGFLAVLAVRRNRMTRRRGMGDAAHILAPM